MANANEAFGVMNGLAGINRLPQVNGMWAEKIRIGTTRETLRINRYLEKDL